MAACGSTGPPPGEELNTGEVTEARAASTVIPVRDGETGLELLLVQRNPASRFMGGAWVFPGGAVHEGETEAETAVREAEEEASLKLDADTLVPFSRWITPRQVKVRFDTHFFVAPTPADAAAGLRRRGVRRPALDRARRRARGGQARMSSCSCSPRSSTSSS